ncbi:taf8p [Saccharomyces arboricola H-6]|uniref:Transcription initiation factor TFIID subunit 8 n=1 Tax=Saccharomyces arboricola (strain H-6 / AS 2.3317 / CBS 10644) TaxID=1160507 RepID=J8PK44_SACAR|nr:taf8p [Saccharomyces arboricola H-6]
MTSTTPENGSSTNGAMVQLTNLPDMTEVSHLEIDAPIVEILKKTVLFQLNSLNICISNFALDELVNLVAVQMDGMLRNLHNLALLQRRSHACQADLKLLFREFNLDPASLYQQFQVSEYIKSKRSVEYEKLVGSSALAGPSRGEEDEEDELNDIEDQQNEINILLPPSNPLEKLIPSWLPNFPPDHTYKFTPEFNHPITDLKIIKREIVKESGESEKALLSLNKRLSHISSSSHTPSPHLADATHANEQQLEIWGNALQERKQTIITESFSEHNIEQYAKYRVELARDRVSKFEVNQLKRTKNPFLKLSEALYSSKNAHQSHRTIQRAIDLQFRKSMALFMHNLPKVQKLKKEKIRMAKEERSQSLKRRQEELISQRKKREQDDGHDLELLLNNEHARESAGNGTSANALNDSTIDINTNADDEDDDMNLFGILGGSSEDENENENEISSIEMENVATESEFPTATAQESANTTPVAHNTTNMDANVNLSTQSTFNENAPTSPPADIATDNDITM